MGELGREGLEDPFEDHEQASPILAAVYVNVLEVELEGLSSTLDVGAEPLRKDCFAGSDITGYEDLGAGRPGFVNDRPEELGKES